GLPASGRCFGSGFLRPVCDDDHSSSAWHQSDAERADVEGSQGTGALANSGRRKADGPEAARKARQTLKPLVPPEMPAAPMPTAARNSRRTGARTLEQASNCLTVDRWRSPLEPIERRESVVVPRGRIGAVIEENLDGLHETCLGGVVDRRSSP